MAVLEITRELGFADLLRQYRVFLDDKQIGLLKRGETQVFSIEPGQYRLQLRIDWCRSNPLHIRIEDNQKLTFCCGSRIRGMLVFLALFVVLLRPYHYLWIKPKE